MNTFKEFLNEAKSVLAKKLPNSKPEKKEGYYLVDDEGNVEYGPWELNPRGFKLAKTTAKESGALVVASSSDIETNKMEWRLVSRDGGMVV